MAAIIYSSLLKFLKSPACKKEKLEMQGRIGSKKQFKVIIEITYLLRILKFRMEGESNYDQLYISERTVNHK